MTLIVIPITLADVDAKLAHDLFDLRHGMVKSMIFDRLVEAEAGRRKLSVDRLVDEEINRKVAHATEAEIAAAYDKLVASGQLQAGDLEAAASRLGNRLTQSKMYRRRDEFAAELTARAGVEIDYSALGEPRVRVQGTGPSVGSDQAPVTIFEFTDLLSPFGAMGNATLQSLRSQYGSKLRVIFRQKPEDERSRRAAVAALCAHQQGPVPPCR